MAMAVAMRERKMSGEDEWAAYVKREIDIDNTPRDQQIDRLREGLVGANSLKKIYYVNATDRRLCRIDLSSGTPVVMTVDPAALTEIAMRTYDWVRPRKRTMVHVDPPATVIRAVASEPGTDLPRLLRVVDIPYLTPSGRVVDRTGYDDDTEKYLHLDEVVEPIPKDPSDEQLADAVRLVTEDRLGGFVFGDPASKANAVAAEITPHVHALYPNLLTPISSRSTPPITTSARPPSRSRS